MGHCLLRKAACKCQTHLLLHYRVGALLLNGKWEAGARLILAGQQNDRPDIAVARAAFLERGALGSKT